VLEILVPFDVIEVENADIGVPTVLAPVALSPRGVKGGCSVSAPQTSIGSGVQPADYDLLGRIQELFCRLQTLARQIDGAVCDVQVP